MRPSHLLHLAWYVEHGAFWTSPENERWLAASLVLLDHFYGERVVVRRHVREYDWSAGGTFNELSSPIRPRTPYGLAKDAAATQRRRSVSGAGASSFAWGRIFFLHGPGEHPDRLVPSVARSLLAGEPARCTEGRRCATSCIRAMPAHAFARCWRPTSRAR